MLTALLFFTGMMMTEPQAFAADAEEKDFDGVETPLDELKKKCKIMDANCGKAGLREAAVASPATGKDRA